MMNNEENQHRMSFGELLDILLEIKLEGKRFHVGSMGDGFYIQIQYEEADIDTGKIETQYARKWYVSRYSTVSEVVRTCYKAALASAEHQVGEHFTFSGERVYDPHWNVKDLQKLRKVSIPDARIPLKKG